MASPCWWKTCRPLKACNCPDSGESLVVDLKVNSNHSSWVKQIWLCLGKMFVNNVIDLLGKSVKCVLVCAFWYVPSYAWCFVWFIIACGDDKWTFVFDGVFDWERHQLYRFCFLLWMREQREGGTEKLAGWMRSWDIRCGCLFTQWGSDKTFHLLALLFYFPNQYFNPFPLSLYHCFPFPFCNDCWNLIKDT